MLSNNIHTVQFTFTVYRCPGMVSALYKPLNNRLETLHRSDTPVDP